MFRPTCQVTQLKSRATCASFQMARRQASLFDNNQSCDLTCVCHRGPFMPPAHNPEYAYKHAPGEWVRIIWSAVAIATDPSSGPWRGESHEKGEEHHPKELEPRDSRTQTHTRAAGLRMLLRAQGYRLQRREWRTTSGLFLDACVHVCVQKTSVLDICETEVYILIVLSQRFFICLIGKI